MKKLSKNEVRYLLTSHKNALVFVSPVFNSEESALKWLTKVVNKIESGIKIECTRKPFTSNSTSLSFVDENTNEISHLYMNSWNQAVEYENGIIVLAHKYKDSFDKKPRIKYMVYKVQGI